MIAILLPLQEGLRWLDSPLVLLAAAIIPVLLVGMRIPDSFAGERERRTLATLLASRLPDRAILFGKVAVAVGFGWGVSLIVLLLALAVVNLTNWDGQVLLYSPRMALAGLTFGLLFAALTAGLGVLISLRAATVQSATQTLLMALLTIPLLLQFVVLFFFTSSDGGSDRLREILASLDFTQIALIAAAVLILLDLGLLAASMARFRRARLIAG